MTGQALPRGNTPFPSLDHIAIAADDRIGGRPRRRRGRIVRRALTLLAITGAGVVHWLEPTIWPSAVDQARHIAGDLVASVSREGAAGKSSQPPASTTASAPAPSSASPAEPKADASSIASGSPPVTAAAPSPGEPTVTAAGPAPVRDVRPSTEASPVVVAPAPPVAAVPDQSSPRGDDDPAGRDPAPPGDPIRRRGENAGLHPDLSRALLMRLGDADFRNAAQAIATAVAETPDNGEHVWPIRAASGLALFRVYFVAGAGEGCRRYVVTIAKDGWLTTALPMERCGVRASRQKAAAP